MPDGFVLAQEMVKVFTRSHAVTRARREALAVLTPEQLDKEGRT